MHHGQTTAHGAHHRQSFLDFAAADASTAERRNLLGLCVARVGGDLFLRELLLWVFNVTEGRGDEAALVRSHRELAARPWGLCCSDSKARATVTKARAAGVLTVEEARYTSGGQRANAYRIDWHGVGRLLSPHPPRPGALREQGGVFTRQGAVSTRHPYKEQLPSCSPLEETPVPEPEGRAAGPRWEDGNDLNAVNADQVPELAAARQQTVEPLEPGRLVYGAFSVIHGGHLDQPAALVRWHRRQLGLERPPVGPTVAHAVLVIAAGAYAAAMPAGDVQKNRPAIFAATVGRAQWRRVLPHVPAAAAALDRLLATRPGLLRGPWPTSQPVEATP